MFTFHVLIGTMVENAAKAKNKTSRHAIISYIMLKPIVSIRLAVVPGQSMFSGQCSPRPRRVMPGGSRGRVPRADISNKNVHGCLFTLPRFRNYCCTVVVSLSSLCLLLGSSGPHDVRKSAGRLRGTPGRRQACYQC